MEQTLAVQKPKVREKSCHLIARHIIIGKALYKLMLYSLHFTNGRKIQL